MSDDWDEETRRLVFGYCGGDPREPEAISVQVLWEYDDEWTLDGFQALVADAIAKIPPEYRASARVTLEQADPDGCGGHLAITYVRPTNEQEIAERVERALSYARKKQREELEVYERLKRKFEA